MWLWPSLCSKRHTRKMHFFSLVAQYTIIVPCKAKNSIFWPPNRKRIMCNTGKTLFLLVWLWPSLCSKLHTRKINFFSPSCTIYYWSPGLVNPWSWQFIILHNRLTTESSYLHVGSSEGICAAIAVLCLVIVIWNRELTNLFR